MESGPKKYSRRSAILSPNQRAKVVLLVIVVAYFWKSRLLVTRAKINALRWAMAHNDPRNLDSISIASDCYDDDTHETRRMIHSSGMECGSRRGEAELFNMTLTTT